MLQIDIRRDQADSCYFQTDSYYCQTGRAGENRTRFAADSSNLDWL